MELAEEFRMHKTNAAGSKLYINLKKRIFLHLSERKTIFTTTLLSNQMHPLAEKSRSNI